MPEKLLFAISRELLIFQKSFPDALAVKEGGKQPSHRSNIATTKQNKNKKHTKTREKMTTKICLRCTPRTGAGIH